MVSFDHFEVHVRNSQKYVNFLKKLFKGGRFKKISNNNTFMFLTPDNIRIEVKQNELFNVNFDVKDGIGFCLPCLRMCDAKIHLCKFKEIELKNEMLNPYGFVFFFRDYEGIDWHIKDYDTLDAFVNI
jgi:hypothetical protein